jgi:hypothetical protein
MGEGKRTVEAKEHEIGRAVAHFAPGESSRALWVFGELVMYKTKSEQTGGAYSLFEVVTHPGPDRHPQRTSSALRPKGRYASLQRVQPNGCVSCEGQRRTPAQDR